MNYPEILIRREVEEILGISTRTVRRWELLGKLKPIRLGDRGDKRYKRADIEALMKEVKV